MKQQLPQKVVLGSAMLIMAICCTTSINAQLSVGLSAGYTNNYLLTNASSLVSTQYNNMPGFHAAMPLVYSITDWFAIKAMPGYMQKNYQMQRTGFYQGVYQNSTNGYVQLPVMGHFSFGGAQLRGYVDAGAYAGHWLTAHVKGVMPNILNNPAYTNSTSNAQPNNVFDEYTAYRYDEKYTFDKTKDNRIELGVLAGAGISYQLNDACQVFGEATFYNALTDQQKKYETGQVPRYNQTYVFSLGVLFNISGNK